MNKYSKRALKTTATVGMSLAMVLSGVAAPVVKIAAADGCLVADNADLTKMNVFASITVSKWKEATSDTTFEADYVITKGTMFNATGEAVDAVVNAGNGVALAGSIKVGSTTLNLMWDATGGGTHIETTAGVTPSDASGKYYYGTANTNPSEISNIVKVKVNAVAYINGDLVTNYATTINAVDVEATMPANAVNGKLIISTGKAKEFNDSLKEIAQGCTVDQTNLSKDLLNLAAAVKATDATLIELAKDGKDNGADQYDAIEAFLVKYDANLTDTQKETLANELEKLGEGTMNPSTDEYQTALSVFLDKETTKLEKLLADSAYTSLPAVKAITNSEVDKMLKTLKDTSEYKRFRKESAVLDLVAEIEALKDDVKTVIAAVDRVKNDSYKEYVAGGTKSVANIVKTFGQDKEKSLTISDYEILKTFKEDVVDVILTMDSKEVGNRWVNKSTKSAFATKTQYDKVMDDFGNLEDFDSEKGKFEWDYLETHMDKVVASLKDLDSIAKLDSVTLQAGDRQLLVAADDAVYFLQKEGADNLTSAEARTVRDASRKVTELMETYRVKFGSIDTTVNGWVDKGNGNWTYYENGSAVTKWVAAGSNWYYVKGGNMVRNAWVAENASGARWYYVNDKGVMVTNTVVDGYTINANGIWTK